MPSTITDRLNGLTTSVAVKAPCRVATTTAINLYGMQTIDGVTLSDRDRVLVKDQADASQNGIWIAADGDWKRSSDFDGSLDVVGGTLIKSNEGLVNSNSYWEISGNGQVLPGSDHIIINPASGLQTGIAILDDGIWSQGTSLIDDGAWG